VYALFTGDTCAKMRTLGQFISLLHNVCYFNVCYCTKTVRILDFEAFRRSEFSGRSLSWSWSWLWSCGHSSCYHRCECLRRYHSVPVHVSHRGTSTGRTSLRLTTPCVNVAISPFAQHLKQNIAVSANLAKCGFMFLSRVGM